MENENTPVEATEEKPSADDVKSILAGIKSRIRVTKVTATRSVKSPRGDHFIGFSAHYDSVQDDAGGMGEDLIGSTASGETQTSVGAMTLKEARVAAAIVQMQADISAIEHACAGGDLSRSQRDSEIQRIKGGFSRLIAEMMGV